MERKKLFETIRKILFEENISAEDKILDLILFLQVEEDLEFLENNDRNTVIEKLMTLEIEEKLKTPIKCKFEDYYAKNPDQNLDKKLLIYCNCKKCNSLQ